jgi:hypothetical protein
MSGEASAGWRERRQQTQEIEDSIAAAAPRFIPVRLARHMMSTPLESQASEE